MSRTDKDRPYEVRVHDPYSRTHVRHDHRFGDCRVGDLREWKDRFGPRQPGYYAGHGPANPAPCTVDLTHDQWIQLLLRREAHGWNRLYHEKPARRRTRDAMRAAKLEYNTDGIVETIVEPTRHSHTGRDDCL